MWVFGSRQGIAMEIAGCNIRVHPKFSTLSLENIEVKSLQTFADQIRPGAVVFDIGAAFGAYTLVACKKLLRQGAVVAYEPDADARKYLNLHLKWNAAESKAVVRDVCCGARNENAEFYFVSGRVEGRSGLLPVDGFQKRDVQVVTLDEEIVTLGLEPDLIKIDVEGAEFDVLKGAEKYLTEKRPVLLLSFHPAMLQTRGEDISQIFDWLGRKGFTCKVIDEDYEIHVLAVPTEFRHRERNAA
jgi:FkbM family methyltransferase